MTTAFDATSGDTSFSGVATSTITGFTPGASANVLVVYLTLSDFTLTPSGLSITWGGIAVPTVSSQPNSNPAGNVGSGVAYIAVLTGASVLGSGKNLVASWTNAAQGYMAIGTFIVTGGVPSIAVATPASASSITQPSIVTSGHSGDIFTGSLNSTTGAGSQTMGQTSIFSDTTLNNNGGANYTLSSGGSTTLSATLGTVTPWAYVGVNIGTASGDLLVLTG